MVQKKSSNSIINTGSISTLFCLINCRKRNLSPGFLSEGAAEESPSRPGRRSFQGVPRGAWTRRRRKPSTV